MTGPTPPATDQSDLLEAQLAQKSLQADLLLQQHEANTPVNTAKDVALSAASGVRNAVTGLPGLPADIANLGIQGANWLGRKVDTARGIEPAPDVPTIPWGSQQATQKFNDVTGIPDYQPQTTAGRYVGKAAEFAVPALAGPGGWAALGARAGVGAASGIASEGAGDTAAAFGLSPGWQQAARIGAGLGTGVAGGIRGALRPNAGDMLARRGLGAGTDFAPAYERQAEGVAAGMPLMGQESLQNRQISQLAAQTARQPGEAGDIMNLAYENRGQAVPQAIGDLANRTIGPPVQNPDALVRQMQGVSGQGIRDAMNARRSETRPLFQAVANDEVPGALVQNLRDRLTGQNPPLAPRAQDNLNNLAGDLGWPGQPGTPETRIGRLHSIAKDWDQRTGYPDIAPNAVAAEAQGTAGQTVGDLKDMMRAHNPAFDYAMQRHADWTENVIRPLQEGPVGQIQDAKSLDAISKILTDPSRASPQTIGDAARVLNDVQPDAFRNWARFWIQDNLNQAEHATRKASANVGPDFLARSMEGTQGRANFQAVLGNVASINGLQPAEVTSAWNRAINVIRNMSEQPGNVVGSSLAEANKNQPSRWAAIRKFDVTKPLEGIGNLLNPEASRETYAQLARAFTSPDSVSALRALAHAQPFGPKQQLAVRQLLTAPFAAQGDTPSDQTPGEPLRVKIPGPQTSR